MAGRVSGPGSLKRHRHAGGMYRRQRVVAALPHERSDFGALETPRAARSQRHSRRTAHLVRRRTSKQKRALLSFL